MIITVTLNPAIDKTVKITDLVRGGLNRTKHYTLDAGGKGINVSKTIKVLGGNTIATGFLGKKDSEIIIDCLKEEGIENDFIFVDGATRINLKIAEEDGTITELNESGPNINKEQINQLIDKLVSYANPKSLFVFAGTVPQGVNKDIYKILIQKVKEKGAKTFLDADGELFENGLHAVPTLIKPNIVELAQYRGVKEIKDEKDILNASKEFLNKGIKLVAISCGKDGAMFLTKDKVISHPGLKVKALSTVGAGDAMVAALSYAYAQEMNIEDSIKLSIATSAGAVTTFGTKPPSREIIDALQKQVKLTVIQKVNAGGRTYENKGS